MKKIMKPKKDRELPLTKRFLDLKIQEVRGNITTLRLETKAGFTKIDAAFKQVDARFMQIDARFESQDAKFETLDTKITKMLVLLEDQNDRNRAVLDSYTTVYEKLIENESRLEKVEEHSFGIKQK
jgi:hypothetical protein